MRILLVEDEQKLGEVLVSGLREHGYAVDLVGDGEEALHLGLTVPYDAVILDLMLPHLDGFAVCRGWRERRRNMPVLVLTARDAIDDRVKGLDCGADDYLIKPFAFRELLARLRALLRREGAARDTVLRVGDLEVDTVSHDVRRAGRPVELTTKEYAILEYFARHPNRVLTRSEIAEHVWDYDFTSASNVIDVYLGYLRRKIGDDREPRLLRTIRGAGYQLKVPSG